jgi:threonine aldolase
MQKITIDLFSDTNCNPTPAMRSYMCQAQVGNEVAGEDPTVNQLIAKVCELLDKEAGIFMPSGTMCNGVAYRVWCKRPGDRIFFDQHAHAANMAAGLPSGLANATAVSIECERGIFSAAQLKKAIGAKSGYNIPQARIISIEQTTNLGGGAIWSLTQLKEIRHIAHEYDLRVHMDGARLFNAVVASDISAKEFCRYTDSVWIDFAKGLGAPMGAVLCGDKHFIEEAWYYKFQQGGAMHQVGILAAGCLYALDNHIARLTEDHKHAQLLGNLLADHPNIQINPKDIETNIVIFSLYNSKLSAHEVASQLLAKGIRLLATDAKTLRAIIHMDISQQDILHASTTIKEILI